VLIYRAATLEQDVEAVVALGGVSRQYLNHHHEASPACDWNGREEDHREHHRPSEQQGPEERPDASGMRLRLELFVEDMGESTSFYRRVLGFEVIREEPRDYASLRSGDILLGIGPISRLPEREGYFTRGIASQRRGLGVEIVMEVDDLSAAHRRVLASGHPVFEPPQQRPWGLRDFRIVDPDGYYLRITSRAPETGE
jgi:lactoylglutathione lyase